MKKTSHKSIIITLGNPPIDEIPRVQQLIGICTEIYWPNKFTANKEQIPCSILKNNVLVNRLLFSIVINMIKQYIEIIIPKKIFAYCILFPPYLL